MTSLEQEFYDTIRSYDFFERSGRMDVEEHCLWAHIALTLDGVLPPPSIDQIFELLTETARDAVAEHGSPPFEYVHCGGGFQADGNVHPSGKVTLLHAATALHCHDQYIFRFGELLGRAPVEPIPKSGYWIDPEWSHTASFFDAFKRSITDLMLAADEEGRQELGYSQLEVMQLAGMDADKGVEAMLIARARSVEQQLGRISSAISNGTFIEAIALQYLLMNTILRTTLQTHRQPNQKHLVDFITAAQRLDKSRGWGTSDSLWTRLDAWRLARNQVIHGKNADLFDEPPDPSDLELLSENSAIEGAHLLQELNAWGINARARALDMSLPRPPRLSSTN